MDPNKEFRRKKKYSSDQYASPRPPLGSVLMIRCDAINCGHKTLISRDTWISDEVIVCSNCGKTGWWGTL